jgi:signal transduction histidine kinase
MAQDDARAFRNQFIAQMTTAHDGEWRTAFRMTDPEGALRWLVASSRQLLSEDGQTLGAISIIRDETARMALEAELLAAKQEAERAADAKAEFLANMSHEIRTPLNCIIGFSSLIEEAEELKPETLRRARLVKEASHALLGVVNDILDISKIEVEGVPLNPTPTDLPELLAQTLSIFQEGASRKGVDYRLQTEGLTQPLMLDPARIRQLVFNLVGNAAKFTETGSITVRAEIVEADQLQIAIADTGVGIPAARIGKIFERFEQADNSTHRKYGGTGLGLPICRAIVEAMGGTITVESVEGQGSTFSIRVPLIKADQPLRPVPELVQPELEARPLRALLADDNAANRELFSAIMTGVGVDLVSVADGAQAVTAGTSETFDIIFMDVHMPVLDGLGATRQLRRLGVQTPIVALTADVLPRNLKDCVDAGMTGYLAKPYAPSDLIQTLFSSLA